MSPTTGEVKTPKRTLGGIGKQRKRLNREELEASAVRFRASLYRAESAVASMRQELERVERLLDLDPGS